MKTFISLLILLFLFQNGFAQIDDLLSNSILIQAQGGGTEKSVSWSQDEPLSKADGLNLLNELENQLTKKERQEREKQLAAAQRFIQNAQGVDAPTDRTFQNLKHKRNDIRIDIEVIAGTAFICVLLAVVFLFLLFKS